jgi:xanthine/uracil permease
MQSWMSQIVVGIIVTVVGTVIAHAVIKTMGGKGFSGGHYAGPQRAGR